MVWGIFSTIDLALVCKYLDPVGKYVIMPFEYLGYQFNGAYASPDSLESSPGVYVIWCRCEDNWNVLDVGEAEDVRERIKNHERKACWEEHCSGEIYYSATYTSTAEYSKDNRLEIEQRIRKLTNPPCGER